MVTIFIEGTRLLCANAGDSRAIKCRLFKDPLTAGVEDGPGETSKLKMFET